MAPASTAGSDNRPRKSEPLESTRITGVRGNSELQQELKKRDKMVQDLGVSQIVASESLNDTGSSIGANTTFTIERYPLKQEFNGLNHRLISYMERVKENENLLIKAETDRKVIQEQLEKNRHEHMKQLEMLRQELDEYVRQAVLAGEKQSQLEKKLQNLHEERKSLKTEVAARSQRESSLERALVSERTELRNARNKISQLQDNIERDEEQRKKISEEFTKLKVENAKLHERMKIATMELSMQESKVSEAEKKLQFTAEDVRKKLLEQRSQLEKLGMDKLEEIRKKHQVELGRLKREHQVDKQNTLVTYVSAEEYAKLDTQMRECSRKLQETESILRDREEKLCMAEERLGSQLSAHEKELAKERKRRDRLNKKLVDQERNHEDIRQELENYRKLIEGLDVKENSLFNTPLGAKRPRPSFDLSSTAETHSKQPTSSAVTPLIESRKVLARRVLTPVRKAATSPSKDPKTRSKEDDPVGAQRDCKMM